MTESFPQMKQDARQVYVDALVEHRPSHVFALFSGGDDSTVLVSWAKRTMGQRLDAAVFIDTGTSIEPDPADSSDETPSVRRFVEDYCANRHIPLLVYGAPTGEFERLVAEHGFPGPAAHRYAYVRLKERQVDRLVADHKTHKKDRIMLLTGVRRAESAPRMGSVQACRRDGSQLWVAPLIDWTDQDMRSFRDRHNLEQSEVAALLHRSGECNCGAYAAQGEREMLCSLFPGWFARKIAPLEATTGRVWGERRADASLPSVPTDAEPMCSGCQLRIELEAAA